MDIEAFNTRAQKVLTWMFRDSEPAYRQTFGRKPIVLNVKTYRTAGWNDPEDCCGTAWPEPEADEAAELLAEEFGLTTQGFEPCEKGWGSYCFYEGEKA